MLRVNVEIYIYIFLLQLCNNKPGQIALEPLHNQKAAVLSLFIQLPCGDEEWSPPGSTGLAIGSALVSIGIIYLYIQKVLCNYRPKSLLILFFS